MESIVLQTNDGKKVVTKPATDPTLYDAPHNPPNTGTKYTRGIDLKVHKARSGVDYFYFYHWSMWQGEDSNYYLCTNKEAEQFLLDKMAGGYHDRPSPEEVELASEYGINLLEETA